jgi:outer membrane lipoprotein-sorting protein
MKLLVALLALSLPLLAHADTKSEGILKEVQLRMKNVTTYSTTLEIQDGKVSKTRGQLVFRMQRPDKFYVQIIDTEHKNQNMTTIINGAKASILSDSKKTLVSAAIAQKTALEILNILSGNFKDLVRDAKETKYITQKMLDEDIVVDVIDIIGKEPKNSIRVYIDNNAQIRQIVNNAPEGGKVVFLQIEADEPIPAEMFTISEPKK